MATIVALYPNVEEAYASCHKMTRWILRDVLRFSVDDPKWEAIYGGCQGGIGALVLGGLSDSDRDDICAALFYSTITEENQIKFGVERISEEARRILLLHQILLACLNLFGKFNLPRFTNDLMVVNGTTKQNLKQAEIPESVLAKVLDPDFFGLLDYGWIKESFNDNGAVWLIAWLCHAHILLKNTFLLLPEIVPRLAQRLLDECVSSAILRVDLYARPETRLNMAKVCEAFVARFQKIASKEITSLDAFSETA
jgi:hypothetical protein